MTLLDNPDRQVQDKQVYSSGLPDKRRYPSWVPQLIRDPKRGSIEPWPLHRLLRSAVAVSGRTRADRCDDRVLAAVGGSDPASFGICLDFVVCMYGSTSEGSCFTPRARMAFPRSDLFFLQRFAIYAPSVFLTCDAAADRVYPMLDFDVLPFQVSGSRIDIG